MACSFGSCCMTVMPLPVVSNLHACMCSLCVRAYIMHGEPVHFTIIECVCTHVVHTGQFHEGDEVLEVNGISVSGMSAPQAMKILVS